MPKTLFQLDQAHVSHLSTSQQRRPSTASFSVDLIHRDFSPLSPFYNPQATHFERLQNVINRSISRLNHLQSNRKSSSGEFESTLQYDDQEYLMKVLIGTPTFEALLIADTGSDLTWLQCKSCDVCFKHITPDFDISQSSSYETLNCTSVFCVESQSVHNATCNTNLNKCEYSIYYGSGMSSGDLASETINLGKTWIENFIIGCGYNNSGTFSNITSGIFGLGGGPLSITNQLDDMTQGIFSYCMVPIFINETSKIIFGEIASPEAISTPIFTKANDSGYYLNLESVIIGNKSFEYETDGAQIYQTGNIVIDSGTPLTFLPSGKFYDGIISALKEYIGAETVPHQHFDLCYDISRSTIRVPFIAFQFTGNATWEIPATSAFWDIENGVTCFAVLQRYSFQGGVNIFGNFFQQDHIVSYNLQNKKLSFEDTDCSFPLFS